jgi:hypothetical protein
LEQVEDTSVVAGPDRAFREGVPARRRTPSAEDHRSRQRRGSTLLDADGALRQDRPDDQYTRWSDHPVSPARARLLAAGYEAREYALLRALEQRQYLTLTQLARRFYGTTIWAREQLAPLYRERMLTRLDPTPPWMAKSIGATHRRPWVYHLDWNGRWALELGPGGDPLGPAHPRTKVRFDPTTIALPNQTTGHLLGVNEIWSFFYALARQSYATGARAPLTVGWRDEVEAQIRYGRRKTELVRPDAEIVLRVGQPPWHPDLLAREALRPAWQRADLPAADWPTAATLAAQVQAEAALAVMYRLLLLEFETGSQHPLVVEQKIQGYNTLIASQRPVWEARYGPRFPRILIVVRTEEDVLPMAALWRRTFIIQPKAGSSAVPVLVTSIPQLLRMEQQPEGLRGSGWTHAMDPEFDPAAGRKDVLPRQVTLRDALGLADL